MTTDVSQTAAEQATKRNPHELTSYTSLMVLCGIVIAVYGLSWLLLGALLDDPEKRGQFGDMFGAVNALYSGLAFAGLIFTINLQREELRLQREELAATRRELQRAAKAQESSERALAKQAESLHAAAKLNALNSLFTYYKEISERTTRIEHDRYTEIMNLCLQEIEGTLAALKNDEARRSE